MRGAVVLVVALWGCAKSSSVTCEEGTELERTCPSGQACDDVHHLCVPHDALTSCVGQANDSDCNAGGEPGFCRDEVCIGVHCGDGIAIGGELCDGTDFKGKTCQDFRYYDETPLACTDTCSLDFAACTGTCGDGIVDPAHELCDGTLPALACTDFGFGAGLLGCSNNCGPKLDDCIFFGWHTPKLAPNTVTDIAGTSESNVYEVGIVTTMQHYDGKVWNDVDVSNCVPDTTLPTLQAVDTLADGDAWVGAKTSSGTALLHVVGTACTPYETSLVSDITDIAALSPTDIWLTTGVTNASTYHFDGTTFELRDSGTQTNVWAASTSDVYTWDTTSLRRWTGSAFSNVTLPASPAIGRIDTVWGTSSSDVYLGGADTSNVILLLHFNGSDWQQVPTEPITGRVTSVGKATGHLFIGVGVGPVLSPSPHVLASDGTAWIDLAMPAPGGAPHLISTPSGHLFVSMTTSKALERYDGAVVIDVQPSTPFEGAHAVAKLADLGFVVSQGGDFYVWNGADFTKDATFPGTNYKDLSIGPGGTLYLVSDAGIRKVVNGNMTNVDTSVIAQGSHIWAGGANDVWIVTGANDLKLARYNGTDTTVCATCGPFTDAVTSIWGAATNDIWAVGDSGTMRHWDGTTWTLQPQLITRAWAEITGWAANDVVALASFNGAYAYDGTSWRSLDFPIPGFRLNTIWGTSGKDFFVGSANGYVFHYDGMYWTPVELGTLQGAVASMGKGDAAFFFDDSGVVHELVRTTPW